MIDAIRPQIWDDTRIESWYRQNIMMFCRSDNLPAYPRLAKRTDSPISIVHPEEFTRRTMGVRQAFAELMGASRRAVRHRLSR